MNTCILSIPSPLGGSIDLCKNVWEGSRTPDDVVSIVSGLHGDQINGLYLNARLTHFLDEVAAGKQSEYRIMGRVQLFPVVNVQAAHAGTPFWSYDDLDLDLAFPGNEKGEVVERLAGALLKHTQDSTHALILKTAPVHYEDAPHLQCFKPGRPAKKMAQALGFAAARELHEDPAFKLNLFYQWVQKDIPCLILSAGRPQSLDRALCDSLFEGLVNLLLNCGALTHASRKAEKSQTRFYKHSETRTLASPQAGLFLPQVAAGAKVQEGDVLGEVRDIPSGRPLDTLTAPETGVVVRLRHYPLIYQREAAALLLPEKKSGFWPF